MKYCVITFRSITPAQRGESVLKRMGISCFIQRRPRWMENRGCGYSLRVNSSSTTEAVELLRSAEVNYQKVYLYRDKDHVEEMEI